MNLKIISNLNCYCYATDKQILLHAWYNEYKVIVDIHDGKVHGFMPPRALNLIHEWWELNKESLMECWNNARTGIPLGVIEPLK